jgi:hypothetical protein
MIPPRTCARKTYVNVVLELFCIRELEIYFSLGSMWDIGMLNPGERWQGPNNSLSGPPNEGKSHNK